MRALREVQHYPARVALLRSLHNKEQEEQAERVNLSTILHNNQPSEGVFV